MNAGRWLARACRTVFKMGQSHFVSAGIVIERAEG